MSIQLFVADVGIFGFRLLKSNVLVLDRMSDQNPTSDPTYDVGSHVRFEWSDCWLWVLLGRYELS